MNKSEIFLSDWASPPGETIKELLSDKHLSVGDLATEMRKSFDCISKLVEGRLEITNEMASELADVLGASKSFWISREMQYRQAVRRLQDYQKEESGKGWLAEIPVGDLINFGWIPKVDTKADKLNECLRFFGSANVEEWHKTYDKIIQLSAFRKSPAYDSQRGAVAAWLRRGEIEAEAIESANWNQGAFRQALSQIRSLTRKRDPNRFLPDLKSACALCGVAVVIVRAPSGCRASGATRFVSTNKAILSLSFRYLSDDHFWFTFFHEAAHLLLHQHRRLFVEWDGNPIDGEEMEANDFAADMLVPHQFRARLMALPLDGRTVMRFAREVGVSPGIIVGQLQHLKVIKQNQLNNLKTRFTWSDS